jgi:diadenosine tetraphosphate (Ap4A) HIT family hydrolase
VSYDSAPNKDCSLCAGPAGDADMYREHVWEDDLWRLTTSVGPGDPTPGFSYLEPKRHIAHVTDLAGAEAATFGGVLARCAAALKNATHAELVYVYIFGGGIPHLHVHLAPHVAGDALNDSLLRGELEQRQLPSGATAVYSKDFPAIPDQRLRETAATVRRLLAD